MNLLSRIWPRTVIGARFRSVFFSSMVAMTVSYILMLTDNVVAGQLINDDAVAAMTLVFPLLTMQFFISYLISDGLAMLAAYAQGQGERDEVERLFSLATLISLTLGVLFLLLFYFAEDLIFSFWKISPELMGYARGYYHGLMFAPPVIFINICFYTFLVQEGEEKICAKAAVVSFFINVILNVLLCYKFGTMGIGLATVFGSLVSCLIQLSFLLSSECKLHFKIVKSFSQTGRGIFYSLYHSMDTLLLSMLPVMLSAYVLSHFGENHLIMVSVATNILTLIIALYTGLVDCLQPMVCQYHAEGNLHSVKKTMTLGIKVTIILSLVVSFFIMLIAPVLPPIFGVYDFVTAEKIVTSLRYFLIFTAFLGVTLMYSNYYIYVEARNYGAWVKTTLLFVMPVIFTHIGGAFGEEILWLGVGGGFAAGFFLNLFYTYYKRGNLLLIDEERFSRQLSYDIDSKKEAVMALRDKVENDLLRLNVPQSKITRLTLLTEEIGLHAVERAKDNPFQMEFSFDLGENSNSNIRLTIRDNGEPYDILAVTNEGKYNWREYFIDSITSNLPQKRYIAAGDENRLTLLI